MSVPAAMLVKEVHAQSMHVSRVTRGAIRGPATPGGGGHFNRGVGVSAVSFSFDRGHRWVQPAYRGLTAAGCSPTAEPCTATVGPIHTIPNYYESGLQSLGDTSVAFG